MAAKYCPTSQKTFTSAERLCPDDRSVLSLNDPYHLVGRTLHDKYRIDALVGLGGMGAVYYAYHSGIDRRVAFKILQPNIALSDEHVVELFEREAKLAGRLSHENIVDVNDAGRTANTSSTATSNRGTSCSSIRPAGAITSRCSTLALERRWERHWPVLWFRPWWARRITPARSS